MISIIKTGETKASISALLYNNRFTGKHVSISIDLRNGIACLSECSTPRKYQLVIGKSTLPVKYTRKNCDDCAQAIKDIIKKYRRGHTICKTTLISRYGADFASTQKPLTIVDNPHYKCAEPMRLYDTSSLTYYYNIYEKQH